MNKLQTGLLVLSLFVFSSPIAAPEEPGVTELLIKLTSPALEVSLDPARPTVISYRSLPKSSDESSLDGAVGRMGPEVVFYDGKNGSYESSYGEDARMEYSVKSGPSTAVYDCRLEWRKKPVVDFQLIFSLVGDKLTVTSRLRKEFDNFRISSIKLPLVSAKGSRPGAKLAMPYSSGRLVDIASAQPAELTHALNTENIAPIGMVYHDKLLAVVSLISPDDQIVSKIVDGPKAGGLIAEFVRRPKTDKPALMFLSGSDSSCTITVVTPEKGTLNWTAGAALLQDAAPRNINGTYSGSFIYSIMLDKHDGSNWTSFNEALELVSRVNRLTGGAKQVVYLSGWNGKGISDVSNINEHLGTFDQLQTLILEARQENATVSVVDNYSSMGKECSDWNESIIEKDSLGDPISTGSGYSISPGEYVQRTRERAGRTISLLYIEKTILLEKFSNDPDRINFSKDSPANRQRRITGKLAIISQFNRLGIDVASDTFTSPFASNIACFRHIERNLLPIWPNEEKIPLIPMIYHGKVTICDSAATSDDMLDLILNGWAATAEFDKFTQDERITDLYYLITLPMNGLANREISSYEKKGTLERVNYGSSSYVEVDKKKSSYTIVRDGVTVATNFTTIMPTSDGRIAVYSRSGGRVTVDLSALGKGSKKVKIASLSGSEKPAAKIKGGKLTIDTSPRAVYLVSYSGI